MTTLETVGVGEIERSEAVELFFTAGTTSSMGQ
jgi:hypothetical protein